MKTGAYLPASARQISTNFFTMNFKTNLHSNQPHSNSGFGPPVANPNPVFQHWTLMAREFLFQYWRSGNEKHLIAFHRHLAAMRRRATEAPK